MYLDLRPVERRYERRRAGDGRTEKSVREPFVRCGLRYGEGSADPRRGDRCSRPIDGAKSVGSLGAALRPAFLRRAVLWIPLEDPCPDAASAYPRRPSPPGPPCVPPGGW